MKPSLRQRVIDAVLELGECTIQQVLGKVGRTIPPAQAVVHARSYLKRRRRNKHKRPMVSWDGTPTSNLARLGKQVLLWAELGRLVRQGKLRRVRKGVYAPPLPKVYAPGQQQAG